MKYIRFLCVNKTVIYFSYIPVHVYVQYAKESRTTSIWSPVRAIVTTPAMQWHDGTIAMTFPSQHRHRTFASVAVLRWRCHDGTSIRWRCYDEMAIVSSWYRHRIMVIVPSQHRYRTIVASYRGRCCDVLNGINRLPQLTQLNDYVMTRTRTSDVSYKI